MSANARPAPVVLGSWPAPLEPAPRLAAAAGLPSDACGWSVMTWADLAAAATRSGSFSTRVRRRWLLARRRWLPAARRRVTMPGWPRRQPPVWAWRRYWSCKEAPEAPAGNLVLDLLAGARPGPRHRRVRVGRDHGRAGRRAWCRTGDRHRSVIPNCPAW